MEEKPSKEITLSVNMNANVLYDYLVYHAYSTASGILGTCFGALGVLAFLAQPGVDRVMYLILGVVLILYVPVSLKLRSMQLMQFTEAYKKPLDYVLNSEGITVSQGEVSQTIEWDKCVKAVSTRQSIVLYTGKNNASIFPRKQLGDKLPALVAVFAENMDPKKVRIRY